MRQFLCGTSNLKAKKGWVNLQKSPLSKARCGVGINKLRLVNRALHAKWCWRYSKERNALWTKIISQKF